MQINSNQIDNLIINCLFKNEISTPTYDNSKSAVSCKEANVSEMNPSYLTLPHDRYDAIPDDRYDEIPDDRYDAIPYERSPYNQNNELIDDQLQYNDVIDEMHQYELPDNEQHNVIASNNVYEPSATVNKHCAPRQCIQRYDNSRYNV